MNKLSKGLSNCKIKFLKNSNTRIRKYSASSSYNTRLLIQIQKQSDFSKLNLKNISTPPIHFIQKTKNLYYFDMDYINGEDYSQYFTYTNKNNLDDIIVLLDNYFNHLLSVSKYFNPEELKKQVILKLKNLQSSSSYKELIDYLLIEATTKIYNQIPESFCHGDLTLNNMIFYNNKVYFIDFLDSFVNSIIVDLIKLKQDCYYLWSYYIYKENYKIAQCCQYLWTNISEKYSRYIFTKFSDMIDIIISIKNRTLLKNNK